MMPQQPDLIALWLTLKLAAISTAVLMIIGMPLAWWLARSRSRLKCIVEAAVALPLVLPPTVLGFWGLFHGFPTHVRLLMANFESFNPAGVMVGVNSQWGFLV